jgi:hypothetical protein
MIFPKKRREYGRGSDLILFKPQHIRMIVDGIKIATRRDWKKPMAKIGGEYKVKKSMMSKEYYA